MTKYSSIMRLGGAVSAQALVLGLAAGAAVDAAAQQALPGIDVQTTKREIKREKKHAPKRRPAPAAARPQAPAEPSADRTAAPEGVVLNGGPAVTPTTAGPVSGYRALTGVTATRTDTPIERIPQTINVIPGAVIKDQQPLTQSEAFANVSSVVGMPEYNFLGHAYKIRGFAAERYVDGLANFYDAGDNASMVDLERIEVVKGPGGLFFQGGLGVIGGAINSVSKLPESERRYEGGTTFGSYGRWSQWFDVNQPLAANGSVLFRMTGEHAKSGDFVDVIERESYSLNPTLTITDRDVTTLTIQGRFSRREQQEYGGLPAVGTLDQSMFSIRRDLFPGDPFIPKTTSEISSVTAKLEHRFDATWSANVSARYGETRVAEPSQSILGNRPDFPPSTYFFINGDMPETFRELSASPNLIARFALGDTKNTLLFGADYNRVSEVGKMWFDMWGASPVDLSDPNPVFPAYKDPAGTTLFGDADNVYVNSGATVQLQSTVWDRLHLLGGVRLGHVDIHNRAPDLGTEFHSEDTKLLPRVGAAFDLARGVTPYVSYSEGLRGVRYFNAFEAPRPEESQQIEGGVKLALPYGFTSTLALFDITRTNVATADPANPFVQIQTGEQRSRGFEADVTWQPAPGLSVIASYAHVEAEVTRDNVIPVGARLDRVPEDSGRLWANYKFLDGPMAGLSFGAGVRAVSDQAISLSNTYFTPGYATVDARIGYDTGPWSFSITGKNLMNKAYDIPYSYLDGRVAPGAPLTVYGSISCKY